MVRGIDVINARSHKKFHATGTFSAYPRFLGVQWVKKGSPGTEFVDRRLDQGLHT